MYIFVPLKKLNSQAMLGARPFQTLTMLDDKPAPPQYGTYKYAQLADTMGLGLCQPFPCPLFLPSCWMLLSMRTTSLNQNSVDVSSTLT